MDHENALSGLQPHRPPLLTAFQCGGDLSIFYLLLRCVSFFFFFLYFRIEPFLLLREGAFEERHSVYPYVTVTLKKQASKKIRSFVLYLISTT